jgi:enamine deaminase RidA (YjgF/YER057c/UK114 family)
MQKEAFCAPTVYSPVRYVQGIKTTGGTIVWLSGQVSQDQAGHVVHKGDFAGQARQALANLKAMVEAACSNGYESRGLEGARPCIGSGS